MKRATTTKLILLLVMGVVGVCEGRIITVNGDGPADFSTIQGAIDDANDGDTVVVADGRYTGQGNRDIDFLGKAITVRSENGPERCIVDCNGSEGEPHRGFIFQSGEDPNSVVAGFTITNAYVRIRGGAITLDFSSSPTITGCVIKGNTAQAGICTIEGHGGSVCSPIIRNCVIVDNIGGGVFVVGSGFLGSICDRYRAYAEIINSTIANNAGDGITAQRNCMVTIRNCIVRGNTNTDVKMGICEDCCDPKAEISYSNVDPNGVSDPGALYVDWGQGNVDVAPCFADPNGGDYHLESQAGRWDANEGRWAIDEVTSPCIDSGNPISPIGHEPFPNGGIINTGAYGGTAQASKSYLGDPLCETVVAGDINGDCKVNLTDFALMAFHWLEEN